MDIVNKTIIRLFGVPKARDWEHPFKMRIQTPDRKKTILRIPIQRNGYEVVRYNGHYHQVMGGIRNDYFLSSIKQGRC